jgi:microcystin degradation protein MlrC
VTSTLAALVKHSAFFESGGATAIFASMPDIVAVATCAAAGVGATVAVSVGGKLDPVHGTALVLTGIIETLRDGDSVAGRQVVLRCGGVRVILTENRKPFHKRGDFLFLGLDPLDHHVTVVKIGYLEPELKAMASQHLLVLSPGAVQPLLSSIDYQHLARPIYPLDPDFDWHPQARVFGG